MDLAFKYAKKGYGFVSPNPMVGAVLVKDDKVIGGDFHKVFGEGHAEFNLLDRFDISLTSGSTLFVTLEPCCHTGKTGPCVDLILQKGIKRVVIGQLDCNSKVSGKSVDILKKSNIEVEVMDLAKIKYLNRKFNKWIKDDKPYITLKCGLTLDGNIADLNGNSKWITSEAARSHVNRSRQGYDAILVGIG
jgi:diaminohydroxyphosphoribosylaminopyrimidine deaminase/5-amino-6-(5-phosphoribosylamino)uracil reductase